MRENEPGQPCAHCGERLFSAVAFCPYCGTATADKVGGVPTPDTLRRQHTVPSAPAPEPARPAVEPEVPAGVSAAATTPAASASGTAASPPAAKPSAPAAAAVPGLDATAPTPAPPPQTPAPTLPSRRPRRVPWVLLALAGLGVAGYMQYRSALNGPCQEALGASSRLLAQGDAAGARGQAVVALGSCSGEAAARARELQSQADQVLAVRAACERALRGVASQLDGQRLRSARSQLDALDARCARSDGARTLRQRLEQAQQAADATADSLRKQLVLGDTRGAQATLDRLQAQNREHPDLPALRAEVRAAVAAQSPAPARLPPAPRPAVPPPSSLPPPPSPAPPAGPPVLVQSFLRDAERALAQSRFDAARTYVDSALRIDPSNAQAASLLRRIRERELQVLRDETVIR